MTTEAKSPAEAVDDGKIVCHIDGGRTHSIQVYIKNHHPEWTMERYQKEFPGAPLLSKLAMQKIQQREAAKTSAATIAVASGIERKPLHEVFELGRVPAALNSLGKEIMIEVFGDHTENAKSFVPDVDPNYVFSIDLIKNVLMGIAARKAVLLWGYHGTGKTTCLEQICARTFRPFMRVQHTINTEESHVVGQWTVKDGSTKFELGPLAIAMLEGFVYCADEYDRATPGVLSVYQPVLEGKALFIKEAPAELRVIKPHPNFRFVATGNTNGSGDESGLYQSTLLQDASNYSRFGVTDQVDYMPEKIEIAVVAGQSSISMEDAAKIVKFGNEVREAFKAGRVGATVSPRELIGAAQLGAMRGDYRVGLRLAFINRLNRVDKEAVDKFAQRHFGGV